MVFSNFTNKSFMIMFETGGLSQGGNVNGTFGPGRLLGVPKPRAGLSNGKFSFM